MAPAATGGITPDFQGAVLLPDSDEIFEQMLSDLPKAEHLHQALTEEDEEYGLVLRSLTRMYWILNRMLADMAQGMGYPSVQWEWKDSQPLTQLAEPFPELMPTRWYQLQLMAVVEPSDHPWVALPQPGRYEQRLPA